MKKAKKQALLASKSWWENEARELLAQGYTFEAVKKWQAGTGQPWSVCVAAVNSLKRSKI